MWHVWTITAQKYKFVEEYLESLSAVNDFLYPMVDREYITKHGRRIRKIPLYNNYIFINYQHNETNDLLLSTNQWIHDYIGVCSDQEIERVKDLSRYKYDEIIPTHNIRKGYSYRLKNTPFKGMICTVVDIDKNSLIVSIELFGSARLIKCDVEDIELER
ncbi:MAG: hypothetical protein DRO67_06760 [Candidatus Asgardarchaeum californiense]|nr:MAG: hypothetical protein DRO67_06760 [Candidatus Asgardarchaeum californiense]